MSSVFTFYDGLQSLPRKISLEITNEVVVLRLPNDRAILRTWYWSDIRVINWPSKGAPGVLSHINEADARLVIPPEEWPHIANKNHLLKSGDPFEKTGFLIALGVMGMLVTIIFLWGTPLLLDVTARMAPLAWENKIGDAVSRSISSMDVCKANAIADKAIIRFLRQISDPHSDYKVSVINDPEENAFTVPGQHVFILSGLLKSVQSQDELAGVLAHEVGHIHYRHSFRAFVRDSGFNLLLSLLAGKDMPWSANSVHQLLELKNSRDFETQADSYAVTVLKKENINPNGLAKFFLRQNEKEKESPALEWLSTHPVTKARIEFLTHSSNKNIEKYGHQPFSSLEWKNITYYCNG